MNAELKTTIAIATLVGIYVVWCLVRPYVDCPACDGGKKRTLNTWNYCGTCQGTNRKPRPGRYVLRMFGIPLPK